MTTPRVLPDTALVGDRLPDVRLCPEEGETVRLHCEFAGRRVWLALAARGDETRLPVPPADGSVALVVGATDPHAQAGWQPFSADPRWCALLPPDAVLELDANLRVVALHDRRGPLKATGAAACAALTTGQSSTCAPVLQVPDVLDADLCGRLVDHLVGPCDGGDASMVLVLEDGKATPRLDPAIKMRRETVITDVELEHEIDAMLARRAIPEIARVFHFRVSHRDPFKLLAYPASGGYFRAHRDNDTRDVAYRRFAISINLNTGAYAGGEFRFPEFGAARYATRSGGALVFSCSLLHEVTPVERGIRYALTTFLS